MSIKCKESAEESALFLYNNTNKGVFAVFKNRRVTIV